jgi:hypothetical protein
MMTNDHLFRKQARKNARYVSTTSWPSGTLRACNGRANSFLPWAPGLHRSRMRPRMFKQKQLRSRVHYSDLGHGRDVEEHGVAEPQGSTDRSIGCLPGTLGRLLPSAVRSQFSQSSSSRPIFDKRSGPYRQRNLALLVLGFDGCRGLHWSGCH